MTNNLWLRLQKLRFLQLFVYSLLVMVIIPFFDYDWLLTLLSNIVILNALLVSLSTGPAALKWRGLYWLFFGLSVVLMTLSLWQTSLITSLVYFRWSLKCYIVVLVFCLMAILRHIFMSQQVDLDLIFAAMVAYLILALMFAQIYSLLFSYHPQSFNLPASEAHGSFSYLHGTFIYYSIIVMTTVGMGDVIPLTPMARSLTIIEAMLGQFFVAVLVAWLVGRFIAMGTIRRPPVE